MEAATNSIFSVLMQQSITRGDRQVCKNNGSICWAGGSGNLEYHKRLVRKSFGCMHVQRFVPNYTYSTCMYSLYSLYSMGNMYSTVCIVCIVYE